jgi:hypothetical protein
MVTRIGSSIEQIALGLVPGHRSYRKFGMNDAVPSGTSEMWPQGTLRVLPTTAGQFSISSSSIEDDTDKGGAVPGTGAWTVTVEGLDSNYNEISETVSMNGTAAVTSVGTDWFRINRMYNNNAGTNEINVGNITATIGGNPQAYIEANQGQTHQTHYTVPAGKTLMIVGYHLQVGRMSGSTDLHVLGQVRLFNGGTGDEAWRTLSDIWLWNGQDWDNSTSATVAPQKTELRQRIVSSTTTQASGVISGYLLDNSILATM